MRIGVGRIIGRPGVGGGTQIQHAIRTVLLDAVRIGCTLVPIALIGGPIHHTTPAGVLWFRRSGASCRAIRERTKTHPGCAIKWASGRSLGAITDGVINIAILFKMESCVVGWCT